MLESANPDELAAWAPKLVDKLSADARVADVASDQSRTGLSAYITIDRDTAGRFGITPATIDNALYDAFGQRIVSTIFTQSNQYRVILEVDPSAAEIAARSRSAIYLPSSTGERPGAARP